MKCVKFKRSWFLGVCLWNVFWATVAMGDLKKQWTTSFIRQCLVTAGVSLNMAGSGLVMGFTPVLLQQLEESHSAMPLDDTSGSWIAAIPSISLVLGNLLAPPTMSRYGRKIANLITIVPLIMGWILIYFANNVTVLLLSRFLQGLCMGMCTSISSLLIGEYTSPKNRGAFLMSVTVFIAFAVTGVHLSGSYLSWRHTSLLCAMVAVVDLFLVLYSPESPSWLAEKGKYEACKKSFRWLRGNEEEEELMKLIEASIELRETKECLKISTTLTKKVRSKIEYFNVTVKKKEFFKPIVIMILVYSMAQWSGINVMVAFPIDLFKKMLGTNSTISIPLLVLSLDLHRLIANTAALYVIQTVKRRIILLVTVCINIFALVSCGCYTYAKTNSYISADEYVLGICLVHIHMFSVATGSLPLCFIIAGEIFPLEYRGMAGGISVFFYSVNMFLVVKTIPALLSSIDLYGAYSLYVAIITFGLSVVWYLLPETKDRTLQDIEDEFRGRPLSPEELKSVQSLTSWKACTTDRRCSGPVGL